MLDQTGDVGGAPRPDVVDSALEPVEHKKFRVVAVVAAVLFAPQVVASVLLPLTVFPTFKSMFDSMGGVLPPATAILFQLGPWAGLIMAVIDCLVFWLFYRLARKYWIGLLFAPLFAGGLLTAPVIWALYQPMFEVITLVK